MEYKQFKSLVQSYSDSESNFLHQYISKEKLDIAWSEIVERLNLDEPIDYILGFTYFYCQKVIVNQYTLIPRPETEELVEKIIKENLNIEHLNILEIGTGSGCISLALSTHLNHSRILASDISQEALEIASQNSNGRFETKYLDILDETTWDQLGKFDIIVSNPPYIALSEKENMSNQVKQFEPHLALFVEEDEPLIFYQKILKFASKHLNPSGLVYFETHQDYQLESFVGFDFEKLKDMSGNWRFLKCKKKN